MIFQGTLRELNALISDAFTESARGALVITAELTLDASRLPRQGYPEGMDPGDYAAYDAASKVIKAGGVKLEAIKAVREAFGPGSDKGTLNNAKAFVERWFRM